MTQETKGSCCGDPKPRILETSGRLFCGSCRKYLDTRDSPAQPSLPETPPVKAARDEAVR